MTDSSHYHLPRDSYRWYAIALAAIVHMALFALLWFGVSWQNDTPVAIEAEVWSPQTREAARRAPSPPPEPKAQPAPPAPQTKPQPVHEVPTHKPAEPVIKTPDIALEREKTRLLQRRQQEREAEHAKALKAKEETKQKRKLLALQLEQKQKQKQEQEQEQEQELEKKREQAERQRVLQQTDAAAKKKADDAKRLTLEKQRKSDAASEQKLAAQHAEQVRRLTDSASASNPSSSVNTGRGGNGEAAKSQGSRADASYTQKVGAKIKSNTIFNGADEASGNPAVEYAVELLPDGSIRRLRKIKGSGVPGFDDAVARAIEKSQPFPPDRTGSAPSGFTLSHKPKDQ